MGDRARLHPPCAFLKTIFLWLAAWMCHGRKSSASTCSSGWRSSARPMVCAPASMSASMCSSISCPQALAGAWLRLACCAVHCLRASSRRFGASFVGQMWHTGQQSNDLEAPMWIVYLAIPLGSSLMCFRFLQVAWSFYRTGELPHHDASRDRRRRGRADVMRCILPNRRARRKNEEARSAGSSSCCRS